jgi:hypothetical protein
VFLFFTIMTLADFAPQWAMVGTPREPTHRLQRFECHYLLAIPSQQRP